ncbi:putative tetratricopeptide repeat domain protein [Pseudomonas aeruginosa VRFPA02]|nr:putative tetratricopeptide repeat domain protein [Pseudomonas aeruginosa VRFPA02]
MADIVGRGQDDDRRSGKDAGQRRGQCAAALRPGQGLPGRGRRRTRGGTPPALRRAGPEVFRRLEAAGQGAPGCRRSRGRRQAWEQGLATAATHGDKQAEKEMTVFLRKLDRART